MFPICTYQILPVRVSEPTPVRLTDSHPYVQKQIKTTLGYRKQGNTPTLLLIHSIDHLSYLLTIILVTLIIIIIPRCLLIYNITHCS